jgi:hypothetical protein
MVAFEPANFCVKQDNIDPVIGHAMSRPLSQSGVLSALNNSAAANTNATATRSASFDDGIAGIRFGAAIFGSANLASQGAARPSATESGKGSCNTFKTNATAIKASAAQT